jgi:hypothetical protein
VDERNNTPAALIVQNEGIPVEDAKKWARDIIGKAPRSKKEIDQNNALIRRYNEELSEDLMTKMYKAFDYVLETVDSKLPALKEASPKATYSRDERFVIFTDETAQLKPYTARSFVFTNGNRINLTLTPGTLKEGLVQTCLSLESSESVEHGSAQSFKVTPHCGGVKVAISGGVQLKKEWTLRDIEYPATGADILLDRFKEELNRTFLEFIELAFIR